MHWHARSERPPYRLHGLAALHIVCPPGASKVIRGWDTGVQGLRVGGKRRLVVPARAGYGKRGLMPDIPPNATLLFDIELERVKATRSG